MNGEYDDFWANEEIQLKKELQILPNVVDIINNGGIIIADSYEKQNVCEKLKIPHVRKNDQDVYMIMGTGYLDDDTIEHAKILIKCMLNECHKHI